MLGGRKACGILIENQLTGNTFDSAVVGIGLNVNQREFSIPTATSIGKAADKVFDLNEVLDSICKNLEARYLQLKSDQWEALNRDYLRTLHWRGETHSFSAGGKTFEGVIEGVDENGLLVVQAGDEKRAFDLKEILYLA
jgi:BirA family transcriptional regulator, biotin operon repressor / biotin---[acetyl-CoA-carboxylase] ligase